MEKKAAYQKKLEKQMAEWKVKIEQLEDKLASASTEVKADLKREFEDLRRKKQDFKTHWSKLQKASEESWETLKDGVEKASSELKQALDKVVSRFK